MRLQLVRPTRAELVARWKWHRTLGAGFLAVAACTVVSAIALPRAMLVTALAWSLFALAAAYGLAAFLMQGERGRGLQATVALAYAEAGAVLLVDAQFGPPLLLIALSSAFAIGGIAQSVAALLRRHAQWLWEAAAGVLLVVLAAMMALRWPLSAAPWLCVAFGLAAAAQGAAYLRLGRAGARLAAPLARRGRSPIVRFMRAPTAG
jgi:uncharacterized membrane protein HdeD (DUF308 family)